MRARIPGLLYLVVILTGMFSIGYVPKTLFAASDAATMIATVREHLPLLRAGIAAGVICYVAFLLLPLSLYPVFVGTSRTAASLMVALAVTSVPISLFNLGHRLELLHLVQGDGGVALNGAALESAVALANLRYGNGITIAMVFWGLWLIPLGYLVLRSAQLPRVLGVLLIAGGIGYVVSVLGSLLSPAFDSSRWSSLIILPATLGELGTCLALLIKPPQESADG